VGFFFFFFFFFNPFFFFFFSPFLSQAHQRKSHGKFMCAGNVENLNVVISVQFPTLMKMIAP
jgi:hypothetical protein